MENEGMIGPNQVWTAKGGMGPTLRITRIDFGSGAVHYAYVPTDPERPAGSLGLTEFVKRYRRQS